MLIPAAKLDNPLDEIDTHDTQLWQIAVTIVTFLVRSKSLDYLTVPSSSSSVVIIICEARETGNIMTFDA